jgi:hypothetical protein
MTHDIKRPRVIDNDRGAVLVVWEGRQIRGYSYQNDEARRLKIKYAHEYVEGWIEGREHSLRKIFLPS